MYNRWSLRLWPLVIIAGVVALVIWIIGAEMFRQYLVTYVPGIDPEAPIWVLEPGYALLLFMPLVLLLYGICMFIFSRSKA